MMFFFAHSENDSGVKRDLVTHLKNVAELVAPLAGKFAVVEFGHRAELWHDLGEFHPDFQMYIASPESPCSPIIPQQKRARPGITRDMVRKVLKDLQKRGTSGVYWTWSRSQMAEKG